MKLKSWPYYEAWKVIWGKDRATGKTAEDILEAVNEMERECANKPDDCPVGDYHVDLEDMLAKDNGDDSFFEQQPNPVQDNKVKKRKSNDAIEQVCTLLGEVSRNTNARLEALASRFGYDNDLGKARTEVFDKLAIVPDLSLDEKFDVCDILAEKVEKL